MNRTRQYVTAGWRALAARLRAGGEDELANDIGRFVERMPPVRTENAMLVEHIRSLGARSQAGPAERSP
jgi:hypothetical protein